jgi:hypothetical protein
MLIEGMSLSHVLDQLLNHKSILHPNVTRIHLDVVITRVGGYFDLFLRRRLQNIYTIIKTLD